MQKRPTQRNGIKDSVSVAWERFLALALPKKIVLVTASLAGVILLGLMVSFVVPRSVVLSYSEPTCVSNIILLPSLYTSDDSAAVSVTTDRAVSFRGYPLAARSLCVEPNVLPIPNEAMDGTVSLRGVPFWQKRIRLDVPSYPAPEQHSLTEFLEVSVKDDIEIAFSQPDELFQYYAHANDNDKECYKNDIVLTCSLEELELEQAEEYQLEIARVFNGVKVEEIQRANLRTLDPLLVEESSIENNEEVFEKPSELTISLNKPVQQPDSSAIMLQDEANENVDFDVTYEGAELQVLFLEELERETEFTLTINELQARDNSVLPEPWELTFTTSGGPEVTGSNMPSYGMPLGYVLRLTFDQSLEEEPDELPSIQLTAGGSAVENSVRVDGDQLVITPSSNLPRCSSITVGISGEVMSEHGVSNELDWSTSTSTTCKQTTTIGHSVEGRPIQAYSFGNGSRKIVYVGGMHGNEYSSVVLMDAWIEELEANPGRLPNDKTLIIIPRSSPDSVVARSRLNARGVDLNRNFPTNDWQTEVYIPGPTFLSEGGGSEPLSEPEASALAAFIRRQRPELVLTYHAVASVVISNDAGNSVAVGQRYAQLSNYGFSTTNDLEDVFNYPATGAFEDWIHDELNSPALLIELATMTGNEMTRNRNALWYTAELP